MTDGGARDDGRGGPYPPRLNPFAFPADADLRFVLVVVAVLGSSLLLYAATYEAFPPTRAYKHAEYDRCARQADPTDLSGSFAERTARFLAYSQCTADADRAQAAWMLGGVVGVLAVAAMVYSTQAGRKLRRDRLVPLDTSLREVSDCLAQMCQQAGLRSRPEFVWNPLAATSTGLAFGNPRRRYVALNAGLVSQFYADRAAFQAVVWHELAHIRNADLDRAYLTMALWQAFLAAALVPFVAGEAVSARAPAELANVGWRVVPLVGLVYLTRNAVLRARELYADVRASTWDGPSGALRRTLESLPRPAVEPWRRPWYVHPDPVDRRRILDDPRPLLRMPPWDAFGTGVAAGIALPNVVVLLGLLIPMPTAILRPLAAALVCAPLAVGVVGLGVWRAAFLALADERRTTGAARLGLALGVGLLLGQELSLATVEFARGGEPVAGLPVVVLDLVAGALLLAMLGLFFRWLAAGASVWLAVATAARSPRPAYRVGLALAGALLAVWLGVWFFVYLALRTGGNVVAWSDLQSPLLEDTGAPMLGAAVGPQAIVESAAATLAGLDALVIASLIVLWAYPLAAWFARSTESQTRWPRWALLDDACSHIWRWSDRVPLHPGRSVLLGAVGAPVYALASLVVYAALVPVWSEAGSVLVAVVVETGVAIGVAAYVPRLPAVHALLGVFVFDCLLAAGSLALVPGLGDWRIAAWLVSGVVAAGGCLGLPVAVCASLVASRLRSRDVNSSTTRP